MYKLFIGFRKIDEFPAIWEAKKFATESELIGVFTLIGDNYHDSWYKFYISKRHEIIKQKRSIYQSSKAKEMPLLQENCKKASERNKREHQILKEQHGEGFLRRQVCRTIKCLCKSVECT